MMNYQIAAFTHIGTVREINQDRILVQDQILLDGTRDCEHIERCFCFVADGIGGNPAGDLAAQFVLERLVQWKESQSEIREEQLCAELERINGELIQFGHERREYYGLSTTLIGFVAHNAGHILVNAGDSPLWLLRQGMFYQLTENQVLNPDENNSPLISYFGGTENNLTLQCHHDLREICEHDLFVLCSDGLFKALKQKQIKVILASNRPLEEKAGFLLEKSLEAGADDNVSCILIEAMSD